MYSFSWSNFTYWKLTPWSEFQELAGIERQSTNEVNYQSNCCKWKWIESNRQLPLNIYFALNSVETEVHGRRSRKRNERADLQDERAQRHGAARREGIRDEEEVASRGQPGNAIYPEGCLSWFSLDIGLGHQYAAFPARGNFAKLRKHAAQFDSGWPGSFLLDLPTYVRFS